MSGVTTCIHTSHGYSLYRDEQGQPYVIRKWTTRRDGERANHEERMELRRESFTKNQTAAMVYTELKGAWEEWTSWCAVNGKG